MGHELRAPLNVIIGFSEMIQGEIIGPVGDGRYTDYAGSIKVSGAYLLGVITESWIFRKLTSARITATA